MTFTEKARIYLDHNATTGLFPEVESLVPVWMKSWGNPSSIHFMGRDPKLLMRESRNNIAKLLGCDALEILFTSCGSESNNTVLKGVFAALESTHPKKKHLLIGAMEHPSVLKAAEFLSKAGVVVEKIQIDRQGKVDLEKFKNQLRPGETALVSMMLASNETGAIFPIREMAKLTHEVQALFHTDAVQALGKIPLNLHDLDVDYASLAGHKFYCLRGSGVLYQKKGAPLESLIHGGGHERSRRAGTENTLAIASLGKMAEYASEISERYIFMRDLRDYMEAEVLKMIPNMRINHVETRRLPNTSSMVVLGVDGESLLMNLDMEGISVSTGAACSSGSQEPSPALIAMGLSRADAQSSLRVSLGWRTTRDEIDTFVRTLKLVVERLRYKMSELGGINVELR